MPIIENQILRADDLYHVYDTEAVDGNIVALRGIYIEVKRGEVVSVVGPSGSGKSTLMKCLGGLMKSSAGDVFFEGKSISRLTAAELLNLRQHTVSFIFQDSNLLPYMNEHMSELTALLIERDVIDYSPNPLPVLDIEL